MNAVAHAVVALCPLLVIMAALKDVTSFTIPNWISLGLAGAFLAAALAGGAPAAMIGQCATVGVAALLAGMALFALNLIGGGDAKLLAGCALWMGWPAVLPFLLATALAGGALALLILRLRAEMFAALVDRSPQWVQNLARSGDAPYGVAIAVGALLVLPQSPLVQLLAV